MYAVVIKSYTADLFTVAVGHKLAVVTVTTTGYEVKSSDALSVDEKAAAATAVMNAKAKTPISRLA